MHENIQKRPVSRANTTMSQPTGVVKLKNKRSKSGIKFLYYFAKCFGLAPFTLGENNEILFKSVYEILYPTFLIGFCIFYFNYFARNKFNADVETLGFLGRIVRLLLDLLKGLSLLSSPLMLLLRRREIEGIVNSFKKCDKVLDHFGVNEDREKRSITVPVVAAIPLFVILIMQTTKLIGHWEDFEIPFTYFDVGKIVSKIWIAYVEHIGIFLFFIIVLEVEQRFQRIKQILPEICAPEYELAPEENYNIEQNQMELDSEEEFIGTHDETSGGMENSLTLSQNITNLAIVYDNLIDIVEKIMKLFSLQIIFIICHHFLIMTTLYYNTFVIVKTFTYPKRSENVLIFFYTSLNITIMIFELFNIGRVCQKIQMTVRKKLYVKKNFTVFSEGI